ncbi:MAG: hypothetical protein ACR2PT_11650 [Endozoicomonas sp.]
MNRTLLNRKLFSGAWLPVCILTLITALPVSANVQPESSEAEKAESTEVKEGSPQEELVSSAVRFGILSQAYHSSPSGMITEGYRYQLRQYFLSYLKETLHKPGNTTDEIRESLLSDWMMRLGREKMPPTHLVKIKQEMEAMLTEWTTKRMRGVLQDKAVEANLMPKIEETIDECLKLVSQADSHPEKRQACHGAKLLTQHETSKVTDVAKLKEEMQKLIWPFAVSLADVEARPFYDAYKEARSHFRNTLMEFMEQGYSTRQMAEILEYAGVDSPVVFDRLYYHAMLKILDTATTTALQ